MIFITEGHRVTFSLHVTCFALTSFFVFCSDQTFSVLSPEFPSLAAGGNGPSWAKMGKSMDCGLDLDQAQHLALE